MVKSIKKLIINECANYFRSNGNTKDYCCLEQTEDNRCIYFSSSNNNERCKYFEECVLPLDQELETIYYAELEKGKLSQKEKEHIINKTKIKKKCAECNQFFYANSNRQKYCPECKQIVRRQQKREWINNNKNRV